MIWIFVSIGKWSGSGLDLSSRNGSGSPRREERKRFTGQRYEAQIG